MIFLKDNYYMGTDKWTIFYFADSFKKYGYFSMKKWPRADLSGPTHFYPPLFLMIISTLKKRILLKFEKYFTTILQFLLLLIMMGFSMLLSSHLYPDKVLFYGIYSGLIIAFLPILFGPNSGMVFSSARPLGILFTNLFFVNLYFFQIGSYYLSAVLCIILFFLAAITSRFAVQTILFLGIVYSVLTRDISVLIVVLLSFGISVACGYKLYWPILRCHIRHLVIYKKVLENASIDMLEKHKSILHTFSFAWQRIKKRDYTATVREIYNSPLPRIILMNPLVVLILIAGIYYYKLFPIELKSLYLLLLSGVIVSVSTSLRKLKFLGEGERYLEYGSLYPACFLAVCLLESDFLRYVFWFILIYSSIFAFISFKIHSKLDKYSFDELIVYLKTLGRKKIICFPTYCNSMILYLTNMRVPYIEGWQYLDRYYKNMKALKERWAGLYGIYPGPNLESLESQIDEFGIDYLLFCKSETALSQMNEIANNLGKYQLVFTNKAYRVYLAKKK